MSSLYFQFTSPVIPGSVARSDKYNSDMKEIEAAFEKVSDDTGVGIIVPADWSAERTLAEFNNVDSLLRLNSDGSWGYYPVEILDSNVANVQTWRNETLVYRNDAEMFAAAAAGYAATVGVPTILLDGASFTIPENQPEMEIVCLGNATITLPNTPLVNAKYVIKSTDKNGVVTGVLGAEHQINDSNGLLHNSFTIEGLYQLDAHWLGAGVYRGF
jgi:hypothetical protein